MHRAQISVAPRPSRNYSPKREIGKSAHLSALGARKSAPPVHLIGGLRKLVACYEACAIAFQTQKEPTPSSFVTLTEFPPNNRNWGQNQVFAWKKSVFFFGGQISLQGDGMGQKWFWDTFFLCGMRFLLVPIIWKNSPPGQKSLTLQMPIFFSREVLTYAAVPTAWSFIAHSLV